MLCPSRVAAAESAGANHMNLHGALCHHDLRSRLKLRLHFVLQQRPHVVQVGDYRRTIRLTRITWRRIFILIKFKVELSWPFCETTDGRCQLEAVLKKSKAAKDVQAQARSAHCHNKPPDISQVANLCCTHQRYNYVIVLLALKLVDCCYFGWLSKKWIPRAPLPHDVTDKRFLPIVGGQYA